MRVTAYAALLRAVNVGGTGKLPMAQMAAFCVEAGFEGVRTYIASGNVVFRSDGGEAEVRRALEARLESYAGTPVGVLVRSAQELAQVVARNPFPLQPGAKVAVLFTDAPPPQEPMDGVSGRVDEEVRIGPRLLYVHYPQGMGASRLRLPAARLGTARNMNTVARLAAMAAQLC